MVKIISNDLNGHSDPNKNNMSKSCFGIPKPLLIKIMLRSFTMAPLPFIAYYFEQYFQIYMAIGFMLFSLVWQIIGYGVMGEKLFEKYFNIDTVKYYGKGVLIFAAIFWSLLISAIAYVLYTKLP